MSRLSIYCDGSSHDVAHRPGGWAFVVVRDEEVLLEQSGAERSASNSRMELRAAFEGVTAVLSRQWHVGAVVELVSDSRGTLEIVTGAVELPAHDTELAASLRRVAADAGVIVRWVRGHSGDRWNEYVDALAAAAKQSLVPARVKKKAERRKIQSKLRR